ncbi:MAG TPA: PQQ-binding-like beta-propeller repeat protein [Gaiellaceae bacterium]|nr:PQQ-binding-like beta-propeller repeat protein [Gaiellaceae bacterium]
MPTTLVLALAAALTCSALLPASFAASQSCAKRKPVEGDRRTLVLIDAHTGVVDRHFPDVDGYVEDIRGPVHGPVHVLAEDGRGGWFIAGDFGCVGRSPAAGLAHLHRDGTLDRTWRPPSTGRGSVIVLRSVGSTVYAGGRFGVEAIDAHTGALRWLTPIDKDGNSRVRAIAANSGRVYVGGTFTTLSGQKHMAFAVLSPRTGRPVQWPAPKLVARPRWKAHVSIAALELWQGRLFLAGEAIARVNGENRPTIAQLNARTGAVTSWKPRVPGGSPAIGHVWRIMVSHGRVFTAGSRGIAVTDARSGAEDPLMRIAAGSTFAASENVVYLGGGCPFFGFLSIEGSRRDNLAALDLTTGHATGWAPRIATMVCADSIAASPQHVLVSGVFESR